MRLHSGLSSEMLPAKHGDELGFLLGLKFTQPAQHFCAGPQRPTAGSEEQSFILDTASRPWELRSGCAHSPLPISEDPAPATSNSGGNLQQGIAAGSCPCFSGHAVRSLAIAVVQKGESRLGRLFNASDSSVLSEPSSTCPQKSKLVSPPATTHVPSCPRCPRVTLTGQRGTAGSAGVPQAPAPQSRGGSSDMKRRLHANPRPSRDCGWQFKAAGDVQGTEKPVSPTLLPDSCLHTVFNLFVFCRALSKPVFGIPPGWLETASAKPLGWRRLCLAPCLLGESGALKITTSYRWKIQLIQQ